MNGGMKMKKSLIAKTVALSLAASMALSLVACGSDDSSEKGTKSKDDDTETVSSVSEDEGESSAAEELKGSDQTWGCFTVMVPDGWTFTKGDTFDENDERYCSVKKSDFSYFDLKSETEEIQTKQYEYNKKTYTNGQKDIPATKIGEIEWTGFEYGNDFGGGFELYAKTGDKFLRVSSAGFKFDGPETKAVLGSLKIS